MSEEQQVLDEQMWLASNKWNYRKVVRTEKGERLRVTIVKDFYVQQSFVQVETLTPTGFVEVLTGPISEAFRMQFWSPGKENQNINEARADAEELIKRAIRIVRPD